MPLQGGSSGVSVGKIERIGAPRKMTVSSSVKEGHLLCGRRERRSCSISIGTRMRSVSDVVSVVRHGRHAIIVMVGQRDHLVVGCVMEAGLSSIIAYNITWHVWTVFGTATSAVALHLSGVLMERSVPGRQTLMRVSEMRLCWWGVGIVVWRKGPRIEFGY